jgi:hypothetical protein
MPLRSAFTVSVDRTAPPAWAEEGRATEATLPPPVNLHTPRSSTLARITVAVEEPLVAMLRVDPSKASATAFGHSH